jgi:hypothetical protein
MLFLFPDTRDFDPSTAVAQVLNSPLGLITVDPLPLLYVLYCDI